MSIETNQKAEKAEYDPLEDPWYVHGPIALLVISVVLERAVTLMFWELESNPIVSILGKSNWLLVTFIVVGLIPFVWYSGMGFDRRINRVLVYGLSGYHLLAVVSNLAVVVFF